MRPIILLTAVLLFAPFANADMLDKQKLLEAQTFWDNRDFDWYKANIPFFECPDPEINTTYYYRWELITKHLTYGSPQSGYCFTEFIDRPFWSGAYGSISCPAGHQLYEVRWLKDPRYAQDYSRYWVQTPGAQPRNYSTWLADAVWAVHQVHPDSAFIRDLRPGLIANYRGWENKYWVKDVGLFWQIGHDDGMEFNINSRQTQDIVRGAPGFRPSFNAYMWADAIAIAKMADIDEPTGVGEYFRDRAKGIKAEMQRKLWDPKRDFFFHMFMNDEEREGHKVKKMTLTHQSGQFAGSPHGREEIGFVPWQFNMPDAGYEAAWKFLMDRDYFYADFGPTTVERHDPMFLLQKSCCWWSGQSWPYATTQTLKAMANLLQNYRQGFVSREDYFKLLRIYTMTQRKGGKPYIAEAAHPDTGSWDGHDSYNHSEHYFHSNYNDLIITGLVGLKTRDDDVIEIDPLAPKDWAYFAIDDLPYHGHRLTILWDRDGSRYGKGVGLQILADGQNLATLNTLGKITAKLPAIGKPPERPETTVNYAVNNDGKYFPHVSATYSHDKTPVTKLIDGNYWYHLHPPNRWSAEGSTNTADTITLDFGIERKINTVKLYVLDDGEKITAPAKIELEYWKVIAWHKVADQKRTPETPAGHRANVIEFPTVATSKIRVTLTHAERGRSGLTEIEAWGPAKFPIEQAGAPKGNVAVRGQNGLPKASASFSSRFDKVEDVNDGVLSLTGNPHNRWTAFESPNASDWVEIDFGADKEFSRVTLYIYDDRGGVQPPASYTVQYWTGEEWKDAPDQKKSPVNPVGNAVNEVTFSKVKTSKMRVSFVHRGKTRSGVSEIEVWKE
jgi:hypothetical protein